MFLCNQLVPRVRKFVRRYAFSIGFRRDDIQDLEQEVVFAILQVARVRKDMPIKLAFDIARKRVLDSARKCFSIRSRECSLEFECSDCIDSDFESRILRRLDVEERCDRLDSDYSQLLRMEAAGYSDQEKADRLGVSVSTIWWRKNQMKKALNHA